MVSTIKGLKMSVSVNVEVGEYVNKEAETSDKALKEITDQTYKDVKCGFNFNIDIDECTEDMTTEEMASFVNMITGAVKSELDNQFKRQTEQQDETTAEDNREEQEDGRVSKSGWLEVSDLIQEAATSNDNITLEQLNENKLLQEYLYAMGAKLVAAEEDNDDDYEPIDDNKLKGWDELY